MVTISVSSAAELMAAAAQARAGDTIALAAGTYDKVILRNVKFDAPVTITSATPGNPAEITGLKALGVENITFRNVILADRDASTAYDFEVKNAAGVSFDQVVIRGQDGEAGYQSNAFMVRGSRDVSITNSEITHLRYGINMLDNSGVTIKGNYFHDMRADGFHGGGLSDVLIADNVSPISTRKPAITRMRSSSGPPIRKSAPKTSPSPAMSSIAATELRSRASSWAMKPTPCRTRTSPFRTIWWSAGCTMASM